MIRTGKSLSRRHVLQVATASVSLALLALAGCSSPPVAQPTASSASTAPTAKPAVAAPAAQPAQQSVGSVTIQYFAWGEENGAWAQLIKDFQAKTPNITVSLTPAPTNDFYTKLQTSIAGGSAPDISGAQGWAWQTFAAKGAVSTLDSYIKRDNFSAPWPNLELVKTHTLWNGATYLIPLQIGVMLMLYAKRPFQEAGIAFPTADWTFDDFLSTAQKLTSSSKKLYGLQANGVWFRDIQWMRQDGQQEFDNLINPKKAQFNQPSIVKNAQIMVSDVFNKLKVSPTAADMQGGAVAIENGNCAMKYEGPWYFPTLNDPKLQQSGKGVAFDAVLCPKAGDPNRKHRAWSEGVMLPKASHVDQSWQFAKYMADTEGQTTYVNIMGRVPNTLELIQSLWLPSIKKNFGVENGQAYVDAIQRGMPDVISVISRDQMWAQAVKPNGWDPLMAGSATAADAMPKVDAAVQKLLDDYWATQK
jgi:multiple sugar transport system substrate-binding protein